jgi:ribose/xylose/arabinose/galactoside ABC-type transport system permease subunit
VRIRERLASIAAVEGVVVALVFVAMIIFFSLSSPYFLGSQNLRNLFVESTFTVLLAAGTSYVLIVGGIDLSIGSVLGVSAGLTLLTMQKTNSLPLAIAVGLASGAAIGLLNGGLIAGMGINPFIVTLATLSIFSGGLNVLTTRAQLTGTPSKSFASLAQGSVFGLPSPVLITAIVVILLELVLVLTPFGRRIYAAGINERAAHMAGVNLRRLRLQVYILSGAIAGLAGILLASKLNSVQPGLGSGYELTAIAAAVIGGVGLAGGQGSVWRSVIGALFLATLSQGMQLLSISSTWFTVVTGISIVAAIAFSRMTQRVAAAVRPAPLPPAPAEPSPSPSDDRTPAAAG